MNKPLTKEKGDTGLIQILADLDHKGIKAALPISEHLPFDLIAIDENANLSRVSVKYREMKNGTVEIPLRSVYANAGGPVAHKINLNEVDAFAIYCPCTKTSYYINVEKLLEYNAVMYLRVDKLDQKGQKKNSRTNWAEDYKDFRVIFPKNK